MAWLAPVIGAVAPSVISGIESLFGGGQSIPQYSGDGGESAGPFTAAMAGLGSELQGDANQSDALNLINTAAGDVNTQTSNASNEYLKLLASMQNPALQSGITPAQINTPTTPQTTSPLQSYFEQTGANYSLPRTTAASAAGANGSSLPSVTPGSTPNLQLTVPNLSSFLPSSGTSGNSGNSGNSSTTSTATPLTSAQDAQIASDVNNAVTGMGNTFVVGNLDSDLLEQLQSQGFSQADLNAAINGMNAAEPHGANFVEQNKNGGNTKGFDSSWTTNIENAINNAAQPAMAG